jgi:transposase
MSQKNYNKQVQKRQRIKRTTLVIGIDIGRAFNAVAYMDKEGNILGKFPKVYNSRQGFEFFVKVTEQIKRKHGMKDVLIALEPTGHYWRNIAYFAKEKGYDVQFIRTTSVKNQRELDDSSSAKTDIRDALTLANLTREGKYIDTVIEDGIWRQLRTVVKVREKIRKYNISAKNTLQSALDNYFPELRKIFWSVHAKGIWAILERCPFPEDVLKVDVTELREIIGQVSRRRRVALEKAIKLHEAARESIGIKEIGQADRYRVKMCLQEVKRTEGLVKEAEKKIKGLLKQIEYTEYLLSIPGIGPLSAAVVLGEFGNPSHFQNARQMIKYAGYDPQENDSGQRIGRKVISKKGRWLLRKCLYFMCLRVVMKTRFFKEFYQLKLEKKNRFGQNLKKKEALCAVTIKLIKVIHALLRDKRCFYDTVSCLAKAA